MIVSSNFNEVSVVVPARNEAETIRQVVTGIFEVMPGAEVIVVCDGSNDSTADEARLAGAELVQHPFPMGNGAAVKSGIRRASRRYFAIIDGDGQHDPGDLIRLYDTLSNGYDLVVGARDRSSHASRGRWLANRVYAGLASWLTGFKVHDLTSGLRMGSRDIALTVLHLLPNGFSSPTTLTMSFLRLGHSVGFIPIKVRKRAGSQKSHIRAFRDGAAFLMIIFRIATLYSPLKLFLPASLTFFFGGFSYAVYTLALHGRFTNMSALFLSTAVIIFLVGLVSEQITALTYRPTGSDG